MSVSVHVEMQLQPLHFEDAFCSVLAPSGKAERATCCDQTGSLPPEHPLPPLPTQGGSADKTLSGVVFFFFFFEGGEYITFHTRLVTILHVGRGSLVAE